MSDLARQPDTNPGITNEAGLSAPGNPVTPATPASPPRVRGRKRRAVRRGTRWVVVALAATIASIIFTVFTVDVGRISIGGQSLLTIAQTRASKYLNREMTIGRISAYVTPGQFAFHDVTIKGPFPDSRAFFHADLITASFPWWTIFSSKWNVEVHIRGWRMVVERFPDGKTHIPKLTPEKSGNGPGVKWETLSVFAHDGEFVYDDHVMPWSVRGPNLNFSVVRDNNLSTYVGSAAFRDGVVQIQHFEPMSASLRTRFQIDGGIVRLRHIDLLTDGAETHLNGYVNFKAFPEQEYNIQSTVDFDRMRRLFWNKAAWRLSGLGDFKGIFKVSQQGAFDLSGHFASDEAGLGIGNAEWRFPDLRGNLQWANGKFLVPSANSDFLGGRLRLTYGLEGIGSAGGAFASLAGDYEDVDAYAFTRQFGMTALEPQGRMHGRVSMGWRNGQFGGTMIGSGNTSIRAAGGAVASPELSPAATPIPAETDFQKFRPLGMFAIGGETAYRFTASSLEFGPSWVATPATYINFNGRAIGGPADLAFHVTSHDWQKSDRLFAAIMANYGHPVGAIDVGGRGTFDGTLTNSFKAPRIEGEFAADDMRAWGRIWGRTTGHVLVENSYLNVTDGRIEYLEGGRILTSGKYSLGYPRADGGEELHAHIRAEDMPLAPLRDAFGLKDWPIDGRLTLADLNLTGAYEKPGGGGTMRLDQAVAWKEPIDSASGTLAFENDGSVRLSSIEIIKGPGKVSGNAWLSWATDSFFVVADGSNMPVDALQNFRLQKTPLSGVLSFNARGEGSFGSPTWRITADVPDLYISDEGIGTVHGLLTVTHDALTGDVTAGSGVKDRLQASCGGSMSLTGDYLSRINCRFTRTSIDPYFKFVVGEMPFTKAIVTGVVNLAGPLADLTKVTADARVDDAAITLFNYSLSNDGPLQFGLRRNRFELDRVSFVGDKTKLTISGGVDVTTRTADVKADGEANLAVLQAFYPELGAEGTAVLLATITGGFDNLVMNGRADITDGRLHPFNFAQSLEGINGPITMEAGRIGVDGLHAVLGEGIVDFSGGILLNGYRPEQFDLHAEGRSLHLRIPEGLQSDSNVTFDLRGPIRSPTLSGRVDVLNARYAPKLIDPQLGYFGLFRGAVDTNAVLARPVDEETSAFPIALAIRVQASHVSVIEDKGTNTLIEASADVDISGDLNTPIVTGRVDIDRGEWLFNGNRYHLESGSVDFSNPARFEPYFDMTFETDARSIGQRYAVQIRVTGTLGKLSASLNSEPNLPEFQIISLLLGETTNLTDAERLSRTDP
ncbi:MAG TPA: translocation/assembly module TamB domain-containing protein, partial [Vicinamibacterales bacterium]|nr:translocation/assembly module TamB domain-containing protein [Vicinamibacterales bacterium]